jgi:site-specific DNA-cytosine methylase
MSQRYNKKLNILELFAGSRSVGKEAEKRGHNVFSVDLKQFEGIDLAIDIEELEPSMIDFKPDMIWASPPCTSYSICGIAFHRKGGKPTSDFAFKSDRLVKNTLKIIKHFECVFYIENPRATLRKQSFMKGIPRTTVWYCRYGDNAAKPTDIWSNNIRSIFKPEGWEPRPQCFNGNENCHHDKCPRGSKIGGTQGKSGNYTRSIIPAELCEEIIKATENAR